jgi:hypothetical protein
MTGSAARRPAASRLLPAVLALAVLVRLGMAFYLGDVAEPVSGAFDQVSYDTLAQRVLAGHGFSFPQDWYPFTPAGEPTAHWSFVYTLYLSGVYALVGHHPLAARLLQAVISGLTGWFLFRIGRRLFGESAGIVAALLWALYAYLIFFNAVLMTQTFYIVCLLVGLDQALALAERPSCKGWLVLGAALGLGALFRQTLLLFTPVLLVWLIWQRRAAKHGAAMAGAPTARAVPEWLSGPATTLVVVAACVLPFTLNNYLTYHDFLLLNSNSGFWFYASNHPGQGTTFDPNFVPPIPAALVGLSEPAIDRALLREALGFISADPARFLKLSLNRAKDYFWLLPSEQSSTISNLARALSFTLYAPFMVVGLVASFKQWRECLLLYMYLVFDAVLHLTSWAAPRYRLPSDAILMVFAALILVRIGAWLQARRT